MKIEHFEDNNGELSAVMMDGGEETTKYAKGAKMGTEIVFKEESWSTSAITQKSNMSGS